MLVEAGLVAFSNACFELADEVPEAQHGSFANLPEICLSHHYGLSEVVVEGFCA